MERRKFLRNVLCGGGIAATTGGSVALWRSRQKFPAPLREEPLGTPDLDVRAIAFSLSGNQLVSVTTDRKLSLWERERVIFTREGSLTGGAIDVTLFNDGGWLAAVSVDPYLSIWNSVTRNDKARLLRLQDKPTAVAFAPVLGGLLENRHRLVVAQENQTIHLFERTEGEGESYFALQTGEFHGLEFLLDQKDFRETRVLRPKYGGTTSLSFSPDGRLLVATSGHDFLQMWLVTRDWNHSVISSRLDSPLHTATFSPDSRRLALKQAKIL